MSEHNLSAHEVLDRAHIIEDMIAGFICEHPVVKYDAELEKAASDLHQAAFNFYQLCGRRFLTEASGHAGLTPGMS